MLDATMPMKQTTYFLNALLAAVLSCSCAGVSESPYSAVLERLDAELENAADFVHVKEQKISTVENLLNSRGVTPLQQYHIYGQLYDEYVAFQFDKAKEMLEHQERLADEMNDRSLKDDALLEKAMLYTTAGFYLEASHVFEQLDTTVFDAGQKIAWYDARQKFLTDYDEYVRTSSVSVPDAGKVPWYQEQVLLNTPEHSSVNRHLRIMRLLAAEDYEQADRENMRIIGALDHNSRDYAVATYWQGCICDCCGRTDEAIKWWMESAVCDIHGAIKDNASLCTIAMKLKDADESDRAFRYIRTSLDDALFYNAKLRKVQIASTLPWIQETYSQKMLKQSEERTMMLIIASVIAALMALFGIMAARLYMKGRRYVSDIEVKNRQIVEYCGTIEETEKNLRLNNMALVEANAAKEEYLGLFLSMSSGYLDKLKKALPRDSFEAELKTFYKTFDTSFLQLYPTFVEDFNSLLKQEAHITVKEGELLSTELRIFALIKLGITQSSHIASLLRYSVNTIYNYRAQIKNSALADREDFESAVRKIGSKQ